jgi:N-acetylglucosamine repressor
MEPLGKATLRETRAHNERLVLATIYDGASDGSPISRADVARLTGLTRTTISAVVDMLLARGLVSEVGRGPSTGGKAPIHLAVPDTARLLIGVDLGDRVFSAAAVNLRGDILQRAEVPSEEADGGEAIELALGLIAQILEAADGQVLGIGIGAPGLVDTTDGTVIQAVRRSWRQQPLGAIVAARFGLPVYVANDSQAAALAEHVFGGARAANLIVIKVGDGLGAGIVLNGGLFQGDGFGAGEIGHTVMDPLGEPCRCGRRGCLETLASVPPLLARLQTDLGRPVTLDEAVLLAGRGDVRVHAAIEDAGRHLGRAVASLIGALHVRRVVLAGPMAAFGEPWLASVRTAAQAGALATLAADTTLELGGIDDIVVLGASALLMTRELGLSLRPTHPPRRMPSLEPGLEAATATPGARVGTLVATGAQRGGGGV